MWRYTKRSSFILLEVFIALSLLCFALHSLISIPSLCFHKELRILKEVEIARLEDLAYLELLEKLTEILPVMNFSHTEKGKVKNRVDLSPQIMPVGKEIIATYYPHAILWIQKQSNSRKLLRCNIIDAALKKLKSNKRIMYKILVHEKEEKTHNPNRSSG